MHQMENSGRNVEAFYTQSMLSHGLLEQRVSLREMGERQRENLSSRRPWRVNVRALALQAVDLLIGQQERERVEHTEGRRRRAWQMPQEEIVARDREHLSEIATATEKGSFSEVTLQCNLLVIEPDKKDGEPHAWAIRLVNPKAISSHSIRKQERVNLLRLYAFLVQEKILRSPQDISVCVAEYVPRKNEYESYDRYPDYFSAETYWSSEVLWKFIRVPFEVVTLALKEAAAHFHAELTKGLCAVCYHLAPHRAMTRLTVRSYSLVNGKVTNEEFQTT
jgi:hypothetical protein